MVTTSFSSAFQEHSISYIMKPKEKLHSWSYNPADEFTASKMKKYSCKSPWHKASFPKSLLKGLATLREVPVKHDKDNLSSKESEPSSWSLQTLCLLQRNRKKEIKAKNKDNLQCRKLWGYSSKFTWFPKIKTSSSGFAAKVSFCHTAPNGSNRDITVLYTLPKRKLINPEAMLEHRSTIQSKLSLVKFPTTSATLQVVQTWESPSKSDCIRKHEMKNSFSEIRILPLLMWKCMNSEGEITPLVTNFEM